MKQILLALTLLLIGPVLAGCEIIAAGIIAAEVQKQADIQWCRDHPGRCR